MDRLMENQLRSQRQSILMGKILLYKSYLDLLTNESESLQKKCKL